MSFIAKATARIIYGRLLLSGAGHTYVYTKATDTIEKYFEEYSTPKELMVKYYPTFFSCGFKVKNADKHIMSLSVLADKIKMVTGIAIVAVAIMLPYCSPRKKAVVPVRKITYTEDVRPIVVAYCGPCHTGGRNSDLHVYADCKDLVDENISRMMMDPTEDGFMPERRPPLSDSLINIFRRWKADGLLEKPTP